MLFVDEDKLYMEFAVIEFANILLLFHAMLQTVWDETFGQSAINVDDSLKSKQTFLTQIEDR